MQCQVAIIGAGVAGLSAASCLGRRGIETVVLEKARGVGGRASTRRDNDLRFDHGAQYFTCHSAEFLAEVQRWQAADVVAPWPGRIVAIDPDGVRRQLNTERTRYVGLPGMNAIARALAQGVDIRFQSRVAHLRRARNWRLTMESGATVEAETLVITTPPAQAVALLADTPTPLVVELEKIRMTPCWALMAALQLTQDVTFDGAFVNCGPLSWVAHDSSKPGRTTRGCWVLHASSDWSLAHIEDSAADVASAMLDAFAGVVGHAPKPLRAVSHRWLYAQAVAPLDVDSLSDPSRRLFIAGDWCAGSRIEGAYLSGRAAAAAIARSAG